MNPHVCRHLIRLAIKPGHIALVSAMAIASVGYAETIVDMNFNTPPGTQNAGVAPNGVLKGGASIVGGQLLTSGANAAEPAGAGLDLPLGSYGAIFSGGNDFNVSFDFRTINDVGGSLFSADGSNFVDPGDYPGDQEGSLNIYLGTGPDSGRRGVIADFWYLGEVVVDEDPLAPFNDNVYHHVNLSYTAATKIAELTVDSLDPESDDFDFLRNTSHDLVRLGDENNGDFGADINDGFHGLFDNLKITGNIVPEPTSVVLTISGGLMLFGCFGRRSMRRQ